MTIPVFENSRPLTDDEYLALAETWDRVELIDGSLLVSARGLPRRQHLVSALARRLTTGVGNVLTTVNLRLRPGLIFIPDVVVTGELDFNQPVVEADCARLVVEFAGSISEVLKMHYYAAAGIPWYLLVEQETGVLHLYRLSGDKYVEHSVTQPGQLLRLTEPVQVDIAPEDLLPPG